LISGSNGIYYVASLHFPGVDIDVLRGILMSVRPAPKTSGDGRSSEKVVSQLKKISVVIGLTIGLTAAGCAGSSRPASGALPLIGRWRQTTLGSAIESKPCPAQIAVLEGGVVSCGQHDTVEFQPDGTFVAKFSGRDLQPVGTWRVQGSALIVTFTTPQEAAGISRSTEIEFSQDSQSMTIKTITGGTPTVETYVRD